MMDIKELYTVESHEKGAEIRIVSPLDGKETDFYISVRGIDSKQYRSAVKEFHRKMLNKDEDAEVYLLVAITKGWRGLKDGKLEVEFTEDKAKDLYSNSPAIAAQIDRFVVDRKNFTMG
mgnify:CR=1 FL=1|jgi:hypothetical protein